jgi:flagellar biosynthesis/type III secretory pathway M-ring protein FliF/YscJ
MQKSTSLARFHYAEQQHEEEEENNKVCDAARDSFIHLSRSLVKLLLLFIIFTSACFPFHHVSMHEMREYEEFMRHMKDGENV